MTVDWGAYVTAVTSCAGTVSRFLRHPAQASLAALSILNVSHCVTQQLCVQQVFSEQQQQRLCTALRVTQAGPTSAAQHAGQCTL